MYKIIRISGLEVHNLLTPLSSPKPLVMNVNTTEAAELVDRLCVGWLGLILWQGTGIFLFTITFKIALWPPIQ
jgi:hypothetical protein